MAEWYWSLHGFDLLMATLGVAVGVVAGVVGPVVGLVYFIGKYIGNAEHDWKACRCFKCRDLRYQKHIGRGDRVVGRTPEGEEIWKTAQGQFALAPLKQDPSFMSTAQLYPGIVVLIRDTPYKIADVKTDIKGYLIEIVNMKTYARGITTVKFAAANNRYWERSTHHM